MFTDAHIHILDIIEKHKTFSKSKCISDFKKIFQIDVLFCASADTREVFEKQEKICQDNVHKFILSFGIHPQNPSEKELSYLYRLIDEKRIQAIGECGFDFFNEKYKATETEQKKVWDLQIDLAIKKSLPVVIHCRKALHLIFQDVDRLKKLPAVIFHGWSGSVLEANSLLKKGVNAYFCIGKGLLRGQKSQIETAHKIDISHLLTETDAPYMTLKGEAFSLPKDIKMVTMTLARLRGFTQENGDELILQIYKNFKDAYGIKSSFYDILTK